jgi:hypothetical protein
MQRRRKIKRYGRKGDGVAALRQAAANRAGGSGETSSSFDRPDPEDLTPLRVGTFTSVREPGDGLPARQSVRVR